MVRSKGATSNTGAVSEELFETIKEWGEYLNKEDIDINEVAQKAPKRAARPSRGPSPC